MTSRGPSAPAVLLRGGTLLTLDADARVLPGADLLIEAGRIAALGRDLPVPPAAEVLDVGGDLVLPGLIQGHLHLGQTLFRGLAEGRRLLPWLRERIWPLEAAHDEESAYWSGLLGAGECLLSGTTTVQDIGIGPGMRGLVAALVESGLRGFAGLCLMDEGEGLPAGLRQATERALLEAEEIGAQIERAGDGRLRPVVNPRFILSCSDELWRGVAELAARRRWPVHTHALEQREETQAVRAAKHGRDEMQFFADAGLLAGDLRIAHGVWLEPAHLARVRGERFSVVHCPGSNLKLGSGIADLVALRRAGVPTGIGADGAACNNTLDALVEVRLAALLQSVQHGPGAFTGLDALRLATSEGARALGLEREIGSLAVGKRADLLVLSGRALGLWTAAPVDPHDRVVFGAGRDAVRHVLVEGRPLVRDGRLTGLDPDRARREASRHAERLVARSGLVF